MFGKETLDQYNPTISKARIINSTSVWNKVWHLFGFRFCNMYGKLHQNNYKS